MVVVFSPQLYEGQLRGLQQAMARCQRGLEEMSLRPRLSVKTAQGMLEKMRSRQYFRRLLDYPVEEDEQGVVRVRVWSNREEYRRLATGYFGLRRRSGTWRRG